MPVLGGMGGGNTITGLNFERETDILELLRSKPGIWCHKRVRTNKYRYMKSKTKYVDGYVLCIPKANSANYKKMASEGCAAWMKFGALDYMECAGDDLRPSMGGKKSPFNFIKMAKPKANENVWFSFITFKSRQHRDSVNKKVMAYFAKKYGNGDMDMPFKHFAYGGFRVEVGA